MRKPRRCCHRRRKGTSPQHEPRPRHGAGAAGAASIALQRHVGRAAVHPTQLKQVVSWLALGPAISNFVGPFTAGLLIDHGGFALAFLFMAILPLVSWFWVHDAKELPPV